MMIIFFQAMLNPTFCIRLSPYHRNPIGAALTLTPFDESLIIHFLNFSGFSSLRLTINPQEAQASPMMNDPKEKAFSRGKALTSVDKRILTILSALHSGHMPLPPVFSIQAF